MRRYVKFLIVFSVMLMSPPLMANDAEIVAAEFHKNGGSWSVNVTLRHADSGWKHYADGWRVVDASGKIFGTRTLYHPHVDEQPFTRSLSGVKIPANVTEVYVEAHDKVHGWNKVKLKVDLSKTSGDGYRVMQ